MLQTPDPAPHQQTDELPLLLDYYFTAEEIPACHDDDDHDDD